MTIEVVRPGRSEKKPEIQEGLSGESLSGCFARYKLEDEFIAHTKNTRDAYSIDLNQLNIHFQSLGISEIGQVRQEHIDDWRASFKQKGYTKATIIRKAHAALPFFRWAQGQGLLGFKLNPKDHATYKTSATLSPEQVASVLTGAETLRDKILMICILSTGALDKEIGSLTCADVTESEGKITINFAGRKTKNPRQVEIDDEYTDDFLSYKRESKLRDLDAFLPGRWDRKKGLSRQRIDKILKNYRRFAGGNLNSGILRSTYIKNFKGTRAELDNRLGRKS